MQEFIRDTLRPPLVISYLGYADGAFGPAPAGQRDFAEKTEWRGWDSSAAHPGSPLLASPS
jgi:hypothetical protein